LLNDVAGEVESVSRLTESQSKLVFFVTVGHIGNKLSRLAESNG
jgi:hypothetical protein